MLYLFTGTDKWSIHQAVKALAHSADVTRIQQADDVQQAIHATRTRGLIEPIRLVWVQAHKLSVDSAVVDEMIQQLQLIQGLHNILIIQLDAPPDQRTKLGKWLNQQATVKAFNLIPTWQEGDLVALAIRLAQDRGASLKVDCLKQIVRRVGNDPANIDGAIEKLQLYSFSHPTTEDVIEALVPQTHIQTFDLPKHLIHRQTEAALKLVNGIPPKEEMRTVYGIYSALNTWITVKLCWEGGIRDQNTVARQAGIPNPKRLYFIEKELQGIPLGWLQQVQSEVLASEVAMKSSPSTDPLVDLILRICTEIQPPNKTSKIAIAKR